MWAAFAGASVTAPFSDDFSSDPLVDTNYISAAETDIAWGYRPAQDSVRALSDNAKGNVSLVTEVTNLGGAGKTGFIVSSSSVENSDVGNQVALYALIPGAHTDNIATSGYTANYKPELGIRIYVDGVEEASVIWTNGVAPYDMTLQGIYNSSDELELTFTVTDGSVTNTVSFTDPTPSTSQFFGMGGRLLKDESVEFNNFSIDELFDSPPVTTPFSDDFSSDPFASSNYLSAAENITFEHRSAAETLRAIGTPDKGNFSLTAKVSDLGGTNKTGFVVDVDVVNNTMDSNQMTLYALVNGPNTTVNSTKGYTANFSPGAGARIYSGGSMVISSNWSGNLTGSYDLELEGVYNASDELVLTFTVSDGSNTVSVSYVDATPSAGQYFGLGGRVLSASGGRTIEYDNFNIDSVTASDIEIGEVSIDVAGGTNAVISWQGHVLGTYAVQQKLDLADAAWSNAVESITGIDGEMFESLDISATPQSFYRIILQ